MSWFKNLTEEEKLEKKLKKQKISLKEVYLVALGTRISCLKFNLMSYTFAKYHQSSTESNSYYQDVLTGTKYYLFKNSTLNDGEECCNYPMSFISLPIEDKAEILSNGYITKYKAIEILNVINDNIDSIKGDTCGIASSKSITTILEKKSSNKSKNNKLTEGKILNDKVYPHEPAIGREQELKSVITTLASQKKSSILVGESGTGKTTIVDELVYKIQRNEVPEFLKGKEVIELDTSSMVAGTKYVGTLEEKFKKIINYASNNDALLFIDEIHTVYGAGATSTDDNDIAEMLKKAIDRENIRVIGTTTSEEYNKYFTKDALKRRFEPTIVKEPSNEILAIIANKVFYDYREDSNIGLEDIEDKLNEIIEILIKITQPAARNYFDKVCNPDLIISIIDKSFADARINDQDNLTINNIIYGVDTCNRIYESVRERTISYLKELKPRVKKVGTLENGIIPFRNK